MPTYGYGFLESIWERQIEIRKSVSNVKYINRWDDLGFLLHKGLEFATEEVQNYAMNPVPSSSGTDVPGGTLGLCKRSDV